MENARTNGIFGLYLRDVIEDVATGAFLIISNEQDRWHVEQAEQLQWKISSFACV